MILRRLLQHKFLRDTTILQAGAAITAAGNLFTAVALSHLLGARGQGSFYVATALYSFVWFLVNLGLVSVAVSHVAAANARGLPLKAASWLAFLAKAHGVLALGTVGLSALCLPWAAEHLVGAERRVGSLAVALAISPLLELPRVLVGASLQAGRRMLGLTQIENAQELVRVFLVPLGALATGRVEGAVVGTLVASLCGSIVAVDIYARERKTHAEVLPSLRVIASHVRDVPLKRGLPLGLKMGAIQNLTAIANQILPTLLMQRFASPEWVAYLRIAQRIMNVPYTFVHAIGRTANPVFSRYAGQRDMRGLRRAHFRASLYSGLTISSGILLSLPLIPVVVGRLFPGDYHEPVAMLGRILAVGFILMAFCVASDTFYLVTNTLRVAIQLSLAGTVVNTAVIALLAWRFPTVGVAWGLVITMSMGWVHLAYAWNWYRRNPDPPEEGLEEATA